MSYSISLLAASALTLAGVASPAHAGQASQANVPSVEWLQVDYKGTR